MSALSSSLQQSVNSEQWARLALLPELETGGLQELVAVLEAEAHAGAHRLERAFGRLLREHTLFVAHVPRYAARTVRTVHVRVVYSYTVLVHIRVLVLLHHITSNVLTVSAVNVCKETLPVRAHANRGTRWSAAPRPRRPSPRGAPRRPQETRSTHTHIAGIRLAALQLRFTLALGCVKFCEVL